MRGIYKITNKINNKVYIGETLDIRRRWGEHKDNLKNNTHHSYKLQNDWNKYGEKNFEFEIISVLDETINGFVGQYVLILYEQEYILKYNSIDNGYNIEETLSEIKKGKKIITNIKKDNLLLYEYYNRIKNNIIINKGGLIYVNIFDMESICKIFKLDKEKIKGLLYNNNIIILNSTNKSYMLNESIFNKNDIISNNKFSNIKFNGIIYSKLIDEINKIYEKGKLDFEIIKYKEPIVNTKPEINKKSISDIDIEINKQQSIFKESNSLKNFLNNYQLNIAYNKVFSFLRDRKILEYVNIEGKNTNYPCKDYLEWFNIEKCKRHKEDRDNYFIKLYLTDEGKKSLFKLLIENNIIENK